MTKLDGVDLAGVTTELERSVRDAAPKNGSGDGFITTTSYAQCGRPAAIKLAERVRPILDRLYPEWRDENEARKTFEFAPEHDASQRLLERLRGPKSRSSSVIQIRRHNSTRDLCTLSCGQQRRSSGRQATFTRPSSPRPRPSTRCCRPSSADRTPPKSSSSAKRSPRSPPRPGHPRLRFDAIEDEQTRDSMRDGAMNFGAGCFQAIRNPIGHLPNDEHELSEQQALERLAAWSLLARWIDEAEIITAGATT